MGRMRSTVTVILLVTLVILFSAVGSAATLSLQAESGISLSEPKIALTKFASLFVNDLVTHGDEDLLHITVNNPHAVTVYGTFRLALSYNGKELGYLVTDPIPLPPGESVWSLRTGDVEAELIVDVFHRRQDGASRQEILDEINDTGDWGTVTTWSLRDWHGDQSWLKENVFNWDGIGELDDSSLLDLIDTVRAIQFPSGGYTLTVQLSYKDPESGVNETLASNVTWTVTNPEAISLLFPNSEAPGFPDQGIDPDNLEFRWTLPELPEGFAAKSKLRVRDLVTGRTWSEEITHSDIEYNGEFSYGDDLGETLPDLLTGRRYSWSVNLVGSSSGRTIGGTVPEATFWMENQPPVVSLATSKLNYIAGDRATVIATYEDDGDPVRSLAVQWYVNDEMVASGVDRINYTFPSDLDDDTEYVVRAEVTDSFGEVGVAELTLVAAPNKPPVVSIANPVDGGVYQRGQIIRFEAGDAYDPDGEGLRRVEWYLVAGPAAADGRHIGSGETLEFRVNTPQERKVTLLAEDVRGAVARATAVITVVPNRPPEVTITSTVAGRYEVGSEVQLEATVHDDFDPDHFDFGLRFEVNGLEVTGDTYSFTRTGAYRVRAMATDSDGAVGDARVVIHAVSSRAARSPQNQAPTVRLAGAPEEMRAGEDFQLTAVATPSDGRIDRFEWLIDGRPAPANVLSGNGTALDLSGLDVGMHQIIVSAIDDIGAVGSDSVNVKVVRNHAPTFTVSGLQSRYLVGDTVNFSFEVNDADGDGLRGDVAWQLRGPSGDQIISGNGTDVSFVAASAGTYGLTLSAEDTLGLSGTQALSVVVAENSLPIVAIIEPGSGSVVTQGNPVVFTVEVRDPDGDAIDQVLLNGDPLTEYTNDGGVVRFDLPALESGPLAVTVSAIDARGGVGTASISLMVSAAEDKEGRENYAPAVSLSGPVGESVPFGTPQTFTATVTDPDLEREGSHEHVVVSWLVNGANVGLSLEPPFVLTHDFTTVGESTVEAVAIDLAGSTARAAVTIRVAENRAPNVVIEQPVAGEALPHDQPITLRALASDPEGHGLEVTWWLEGLPIAAGHEAQVSLTQSGAQRLTARAQDAYGAMGEASIQVEVEAPAGELPSPVIVEPMENQTVVADQDVAFVAVNVPDGAVVVWRSSLTGEIAGSLQRMNDGEVRLVGELDPGEHVVALLVDGVQRDEVTVTAFHLEEERGTPQGVATVLLFTDVDGSGVHVRRGGGANAPPVKTLGNVDDIGLELSPGYFIWLDPGESIEILFYDDSVGNDGFVQISNPGDARGALRVNVAQIAGAR